MMNPEKVDKGVKAYCPECKTSSSFYRIDYRGEPYSSFSSVLISDNDKILCKELSQKDLIPNSVIYQSLRCGGCDRGAMSKFYSLPNNQGSFLAEFYPSAIINRELPTATPDEIKKEFREAEICFANKCNRAASAMLRSTLEKVLKKNGYKKLKESGYDSMGLEQKIEEAAKDQSIHKARAQKVKSNVKVLGDEVVHREYRYIPDDEVLSAMEYTVWIINDLYDDRETALSILKEAGRIE